MLSINANAIKAKTGEKERFNGNICTFTALKALAIVLIQEFVWLILFLENLSSNQMCALVHFAFIGIYFSYCTFNGFYQGQDILN